MYPCIFVFIKWSHSGAHTALLAWPQQHRGEKLAASLQQRILAALENTFEALKLHEWFVVMPSLQPPVQGCVGREGVCQGCSWSMLHSSYPLLTNDFASWCSLEAIAGCSKFCWDWYKHKTSTKRRKKVLSAGWFPILLAHWNQCLAEDLNHNFVFKWDEVYPSAQGQWNILGPM